MISAITDNSEDSEEVDNPALDIPPYAPPSVLRRFRQFGNNYRWFLLLNMLCGSLATMLAATTINVALPAIIGAYGLGQDQAQWMSTAFLAASTIAMLANAWAMARFGPRLTYMFGMVVFVIGSIMGFAATDYSTLILARALQGLAAGLVQPMSMYLIFQTFPDSRRGAAMGIFSIGVVLAPAFGPALGGLAVDWVNWRMVFLATVPLALLALPLAYALMPATDKAKGQKAPPFDFIGLILISIAVVGTLAFIANGSRHGWMSDISIIRGLAAITAFLALIWWELKHPFPALNPRIFTYPQFTYAGVLIAFTGVAIYGSTYLIPIFVQMVQNYSPSAAGIMMVPAGIAMIFGFPIAGRLTDKLDPRLLLGFGVVSFGWAMHLLSGISAATPYWVLVGWVVLSRVGISFCMPPSNTTAARGVPDELLASATGAISFLMQVGGALGVNILAVILQQRTIFHGEHLSQGLVESNAEMLYQHHNFTLEAVRSGVPMEQAFQDGFIPIGYTVATEALVLGFRDCFHISVYMFIIAFIFICFMPKPKMAQS